MHYRETCSKEDWDRLKPLYQAELHRLDWGFNRLLTALDKQGLIEPTLIIFKSDHGEGFDPDRGRIHHGGRLHQDQIRIPFFIFGPGIHPRIIKTPISIVDIMPTVLELCDIAILQELDGVSFVQVLKGEKDSRSHPIYVMEHFHWWDSGRRHDLPYPKDKPLSIAVIQRGNWYIRDRKGVELHDMINDSLQRSSLAITSPMISEFSNLADMRSKYKSSAPTATPGNKVLGQLRSLGYIK